MAVCAPPLKILIVEDEALLSMDLEFMLEEAGHRVLALASGLEDVRALDMNLRPDIAFVDVQLEGEASGLDVCMSIHERWPDTVVIFVTANPKKIPEDFAGGQGLIPKPFTRSGVLNAMRYLEEGVCDPPPVSPVPSSFVASPAFALKLLG